MLSVASCYSSFKKEKEKEIFKCCVMSFRKFETKITKLLC